MEAVHSPPPPLSRSSGGEDLKGSNPDKFRRTWKLILAIFSSSVQFVDFPIHRNLSSVSSIFFSNVIREDIAAKL